jgi:hypothetical protein
MAGWASHCQNKLNRQNHAHRPRLQKLHLAQKKLASESHAGTSSFSQFSVGFCMGRWRHKAPKARFGGKTFYFVRKSFWGISELPGEFCIEKHDRRIEASPMVLRVAGSSLFW